MRIHKLSIMLLVLFLGLFSSGQVMAIGTNPFDPLRPMTDRDQNKLFDDFEMELQTAKDYYPVIIHLTEAANPNLISYLKAGIGEFPVTYTYTYFNGFAARLSGKQVSLLKDYPVVKKIQWDAPVEVHMSTASEGYNITQARHQYSVDGSRDGDLAIYTPKDVVIAFVDTGIDVGHADLPQSKVIGWLDLLNNKATPYDDHGHGTHVAGIATGIGAANPECTGVAPGAAVVMVKALNGSGKSRMSIVDAGIEWIMMQKETLGIDVLSVSFGSRGPADGTDSTSCLINQAVARGISVIVAAGNQGPGKQTIGSPGAAAKAITVGGMADRGEGGDFLAYFTSRGPTLDNRAKPDVCGPAWRIMAPQANTQNQYIVFSGTSMAVPFTAGAVALLLDQNPLLTPAQLKEALLKNAEDWGPDGWDVDYGMGKLQLSDALLYVKNSTLSMAKKVEHQRGQEDLPEGGFYDQWLMDVGNTEEFIAITMVTELDSLDDDFNLYLYDPHRNLVAKGERGGRHEWISYKPTMTGPYTLEVVSYKGSGEYYLDVVGDVSLFYIIVDNRY